MGATEVLEIHLEELGQHSWWKALLNSLGGTNGSAQFRFVARAPGDDGGGAADRAVGGTFPVMRWQDLDDPTEPNAWIDTAQERLEELDRLLTAEGWQRVPGRGAHWWSLRYQRLQARLLSGDGSDPAARQRLGG